MTHYSTCSYLHAHISNEKANTLRGKWQHDKPTHKSISENPAFWFEYFKLPTTHPILCSLERDNLQPPTLISIRIQFIMQYDTSQDWVLSMHCFV